MIIGKHTRTHVVSDYHKYCGAMPVLESIDVGLSFAWPVSPEFQVKEFFMSCKVSMNVRTPPWQAMKKQCPGLSRINGTLSSIICHDHDTKVLHCVIKIILCLHFDSLKQGCFIRPRPEGAPGHQYAANVVIDTCLTCMHQEYISAWIVRMRMNNQIATHYKVCVPRSHHVYTMHAYVSHAHVTSRFYHTCIPSFFV
jgi:hypothetical protein